MLSGSLILRWGKQSRNYCISVPDLGVHLAVEENPHPTLEEPIKMQRKKHYIIFFETWLAVHAPAECCFRLTSICHSLPGHCCIKRAPATPAKEETSPGN
jgi:hypothetical protein